jgi:predicted enzyme related to lactoylglutathione lyase
MQRGNEHMKILGFGGIFLRTRNKDLLRKWYEEVFNIEMEDWHGTTIKPKEGNETVFSFFKEQNEYFPLHQQVMLNFQIDSMDDFLEHIKQMGIPLVKEVEKNEFGTFATIADPDGRWIEVWEK